MELSADMLMKCPCQNCNFYIHMVKGLKQTMAATVSNQLTGIITIRARSPLTQNNVPLEIHHKPTKPCTTQSNQLNES